MQSLGTRAEAEGDRGRAKLEAVSWSAGWSYQITFKWTDTDTHTHTQWKPANRLDARLHMLIIPSIQQGIWGILRGLNILIDRQINKQMRI